VFVTETRRVLNQDPKEFARETVLEIEGARSMGANSADEIADALNRSGYTNWRGRQWDADQVVEFLASADAELARRDLAKK
jgi:hypothetical protein